MFGPGIAINASAARANSASVDGAGIWREYRQGQMPREGGCPGRGDVAKARPSFPEPSGQRATLGRVIARVEPLTTTRRLSGPFDYRVEGSVEVGALVRMPFGHQKLDGVVVGVAETTEVPAEKLVDVTSVLGDSIPRDLVDLALWMAEEYCSTPARALSLVSPPPGKAKTAFWAAATGAEGRVNANQAALLAELPRFAGRDLAALRRLEKRGLVEIAERVARRVPRTNPAPDHLV